MRWDSASTNNVLGQHLEVLGQRLILKQLWDRATLKQLWDRAYMSLDERSGTQRQVIAGTAKKELLSGIPQLASDAKVP